MEYSPINMRMEIIIVFDIPDRLPFREAPRRTARTFGPRR